MKLQELVMVNEDQQYNLFVDLDGVLADFEHGIQQALKTVYGPDTEYSEQQYENDSKYRNQMWKAVKQYQNKHDHELWYELPLLNDANQLWNFVKQYNPEILTATGNPEYGSDQQKRKWVAKHFGNDVQVNLVRKAAEKKQHAAESHILIDDKEKAIQPWREAGGIGILHTSAADTIAQLKKLGL